MKATTLKIEEPLLNKLHHFRPKDISFSAFVRGILEKEVRRRKMQNAASQYMEFLASDPIEKKWLEDWDASDLLVPPKKLKEKKPL